MRPLKHLVLAVLLIVAVVCTSEVALRVHRLRSVLAGLEQTPQDELVRPCPLAYQHLPFGFTGTRRSVDGSEIEIQTNSLGLRGPEVPVPKNPGHYRIVCLGDEATLAPDIVEEGTFCRLLEGVLQPAFEAKVEVLNAGQPGHCPLLNLAWARARLLGLQPDLVILCCDVSDVADDKHCRPLARFDEKGNLLSVAHPAARDRATDWVSAVENEFVIASLLGSQLEERLARPAGQADRLDHAARSDDLVTGEIETSTAAVDLAWEPLAGLRKFCDQISSGFVVAVVPSSATVRSAESSQSAGVTDRVGEMFRLLVERAHREKIPFLDASPEFAKRESRSRLFLSPSGALSTEGHRLFADILGQALIARSNQQSAPRALPVGGELPAAPLESPPLPSLERRPRSLTR